MVKCCQNCAYLGLAKCWTYDDIARWHSNESVVKTNIFTIRCAASDMIVRNSCAQDAMITTIENKEE